MMDFKESSLRYPYKIMRYGQSFVRVLTLDTPSHITPAKFGHPKLLSQDWHHCLCKHGWSCKISSTQDTDPQKGGR